MKRALSCTLLAAALAGCVVVPATRETYDADCKILRKEMVLETTRAVSTFGQCNNAECAGLLATMGVVAAASAVVSGSIAVAGNVVYWFERQGRCPAREGDAAAPPTLPASSTISAPAPP